MENAASHVLRERADPTTGRQFDPIYFGFAYGGLRSIWVIVYTVLCIWLLAWLIETTWKMFARSAYSMKELPPAPGQKAGMEREFYARKGPSMGQRLANANRLTRDMFVIFTAATVISYTGYGVTGGPTALLWIAFAFALLWIAIKVFWENAYVDCCLLLVVLILIIIVFALAFNGSPNPFLNGGQLMAPNNFDYALKPM